VNWRVDVQPKFSLVGVLRAHRSVRRPGCETNKSFP
jgi:hypothetical protein